MEGKKKKKRDKKFFFLNLLKDKSYHGIKTDNNEFEPYLHSFDTIVWLYSYLKNFKKLYNKKKPILFVLRCQLSKLIVWIDIVNKTRSIGWKTRNIS